MKMAAFKVGRSEDIVGEKVDKCITDSLIKAGAGAALGVVFSVLIFKRKGWPIAFGLGTGIGMAVSNCQHEFKTMNSHLPGIALGHLCWVTRYMVWLCSRLIWYMLLAFIQTLQSGLGVTVLSSIGESTYYLVWYSCYIHLQTKSDVPKFNAQIPEAAATTEATSETA